MTYVPTTAPTTVPFDIIHGHAVTPTTKIEVEETEIVSLQEIGAFLLDSGKITTDWLKEFWGFEYREIGGGVKGMLPYRELKYPAKVKRQEYKGYGLPYYDLNSHRLLLDGSSYKLGKSGHYFTYQKVKMDRGRFFGWMWSRGYLPKGWGI